VLKKALRILELVQASGSRLGVNEIGQKTKISRSTAYRVLSHLELEGYVARTDRGVYRIGAKLVRLASQASSQSTLQEVARPMLQKLSQATGETVNLAVLDDDQVLYIEVIESAHEFRLVSKIGMRRPVYSTALGKALAAFLRPRECEALIGLMGFQPLTPQTLTSRTELEREFDWIRRQGYALDNEETVLGARCVGAPILNSSGEALASVSIAGPSTRVSEDKIPRLAVALKQAATEISNYLGVSELGRSASPGGSLLGDTLSVRTTDSP
jgi:DNA-binding IclR family transcriptional regulator